MRIAASTHSRAFKPRTDKKIAKMLGCEADTRDMVGRLELNATASTDFALLRELSMIFFGGERAGGGKLTIINAKGQEFTYTTLTRKQLNARAKRAAKKAKVSDGITENR